MAMRLIQRLQARGAPLGVSFADSLSRMTRRRRRGRSPPSDWTVTILLVAASVALGAALSRWTENPVFTLPVFVWALFVGAVLRNTRSHLRKCTKSMAKRCPLPARSRCRSFSRWR